MSDLPRAGESCEVLLRRVRLQVMGQKMHTVKDRWVPAKFLRAAGNKRAIVDLGGKIISKRISFIRKSSMQESKTEHSLRVFN